MFWLKWLHERGYGCNHAVFLSSCDHEANEYKIWTWGSLACRDAVASLSQLVMQWLAGLGGKEYLKICLVASLFLNFQSWIVMHSVSAFFRSFCLSRFQLLQFPAIPPNVKPVTHSNLLKSLQISHSMCSIDFLLKLRTFNVFS